MKDIRMEGHGPDSEESRQNPESSRRGRYPALRRNWGAGPAKSSLLSARILGAQLLVLALLLSLSYLGYTSAGDSGSESSPPGQEAMLVPEMDPLPDSFESQADYEKWVEAVGYPGGYMSPEGAKGIVEDYFHTPSGTAADASGRIVIGDSRCCQLGIYQQRTNRSDYAVYAVWGGHYILGESPSILSDELTAEVEDCFQRQILAGGTCTIYLFATVNDYDFSSSDNTASIRATISAAEYFSSLSFQQNGVSFHPSVLVIGFDGCHTTAPFFGIPPEEFNRYVDDYNSALLSAVHSSELLAPLAAHFTDVPAITGGATTFINDGLHYSDSTLRDISAYLVSQDPS